MVFLHKGELKHCRLLYAVVVVQCTLSSNFFTDVACVDQARDWVEFDGLGDGLVWIESGMYFRSGICFSDSYLGHLLTDFH